MISLGALYIVAVLAAAVLWGLLFAVAVSIVSLLVFNWFFLPPVHTFALEDPANWAALLVYLEHCSRDERAGREDAEAGRGG